ncbi:MAG: hypothetical protein JWP44_4320, partial [Mucilaginibacter sp.]|nr:hypothetical protein [Mucilaginibacter sp.]
MDGELRVTTSREETVFTLEVPA